MSADLQVLETEIGHRFQDRNLLIRALTHKSHSSEVRQIGEPGGDNERLEFLGDSILGFVVSEWLLREYPDFQEGRLSMLKARLVSATHLYEKALEISLGEYLQLGRSEEKSGGRAKQRLLANAFEALIAAVYLDAGMAAAEALILRHVVARFDPAVELNYKGLLAERLQRMGLPDPRYVTVAVKGPEHAKIFHVEVHAGEGLVFRGEGSSKKMAGLEAARGLLTQLDADNPEQPVAQDQG